MFNKCCFSESYMFNKCCFSESYMFNKCCFSESYMFNKLEEIAKSAEPRTPVLGGMISKALEPRNVNADVSNNHFDRP